MNKPQTLYILGIKRRGEAHYGITSWMGDSPIYYAIYDQNPGCWDTSTKVKPLAIGEEKDLEKMDGWIFIGFGWAGEPTPPETEGTDDSTSDR